MFKKISIISYNKNGELSIRMILGLKKYIEATDFNTAKDKVRAVIASQVKGDSKYTVTWERNGCPEGYMVS